MCVCKGLRVAVSHNVSHTSCRGRTARVILRAREVWERARVGALCLALRRRPWC